MNTRTATGFCLSLWHSGSHCGWSLSSKGHWLRLDILTGGGLSYWHLAGTGQGGCRTPYKAPYTKEPSSPKHKQAPGWQTVCPPFSKNTHIKPSQQQHPSPFKRAERARLNQEEGLQKILRHNTCVFWWVLGKSSRPNTVWEREPDPCEKPRHDPPLH